MAYEKFIKKDGKIYGPYIYTSKRIDGKVISEYHGSKKLDYKKILSIIFGILFLIAVIYVLFFSEKEITGKSIFNLEANYLDGELKNGKLRLFLQEGELLPKTSKLVFDNNGDYYEYDLKDFVKEEPISGNFYVQNTEISGQGEGYGIKGEKKIYPKVYFVLSILSEEKQEKQATESEKSTETTDEKNAETESETTIEQTPEQTTEITETVESIIETTEETEETAPITGSAISRLFGITGNAIVEYEEEIEGEVFGKEIFNYKLSEGERAEIKPKSVRTDSKSLSDNDISIEIKDNEVIVKTNYYETETGFGKDYIGENTKEIIIDISELGLFLDEGNLKITLKNNEQEILSLSTILESNGININEIIEKPISEEDIKKSDSEIIESTFQIQKNLTTPETIEKTFLPEVFELTETERALLIEKFGNVSLEIKKATEQRGFITLRYEIGNYWAEYSYNANLSKETLELFMQKDKIKWLKDIAKSLSNSEELEKNLEEFLGNSSV